MKNEFSNCGFYLLWRELGRGVILLTFYTLHFTSFAQDAHFSQFYYSPLFINPANTGVFNGNYRFSTNYKNQWQSISNPYRTVFAGLELALPSKNLGIGISFLSDKSGKSKMGITQGNISVSYNLHVNDKNSVVTGLQYGIGQRSITIQDLKWDSQFNGTSYDPSAPTGESQVSSAFIYMDVSAGVMWNYTATHSSSRFKSSLGIAVFHANQPQQAFEQNDKLPYKIVINYNNQFKLADNPVYILPQLLFITQGPSTEIDAGALVKYIVGHQTGDLIATNRVDKRYSSSALYIGGQLRYKDAFTIMTAFEFRKGLLISTSYDINVSKLYVASQFRGGIELALIYRGFFQN